MCAEFTAQQPESTDQKEETSDAADGDHPTLQDYEDELKTLYFKDGIRRIDFVLAYQESEGSAEKREAFHENLVEEGLEIEIEEKECSQDKITCFVKIHVPWEVLVSYGEILGLKMPIKQEKEEERTSCEFAFTSDAVEIFAKPKSKIDPRKEGGIMNYLVFATNIFSYNHTLIPDEPRHFCCSFSEHRIDQFLIQDKETFFSYAQRSYIAYEILNNTYYTIDGPPKKGLRRLLSNNCYLASYPLHDGPQGKGTFHPGKEFLTDRRALSSEWGRISYFYKEQPLDLVRKYFGDKTGLYFAFLIFYTKMLVLPASFGVLAFFYGISSMDSNVPSNEICETRKIGNIVMCPDCNSICPYWYLKKACTITKVFQVVDNPIAMAFSVFITVWACMFHKLWKRRQAELKWEWNLADADCEKESIRPEYEDHARSYRLNRITMDFEPVLPFWQKVLRNLVSISVLLIMVSLFITAITALTINRLKIASLARRSKFAQLEKHYSIIASSSGAILNLIAIMIGDKVYSYVALWITEFERPRTQMDFEDSLTWKMFLFQSVNTYSALIYIAFFKGRFFKHPGDSKMSFLKIRQDQCELDECLYEVAIQLAVIMIGKQLIISVLRWFIVEIRTWWNLHWRLRKVEEKVKAKTRWEKDYNLIPCDINTLLFYEYLELMMQFGFVTLFVMAFPLAPLFAIINNLIKIRLDANRYVNQMRRPLASRVPDIGAWAEILHGLSIFGVITNAFLIAYTSEFIPQMVYVYWISPDKSLFGYVNYSLSFFNVSDLKNDTIPVSPEINNTAICRYPDYRHPPSSPNKYEYTLQYWYIFCARLSFVIIFQHVVIALKVIGSSLVADTPEHIRENILREKHLAREALAELVHIKSKVKARRQTLK